MPLPDGGKFLTICAFVQITIPQCDGLKETVKQLYRPTGTTRIREKQRTVLHLNTEVIRSTEVFFKESFWDGREDENCYIPLKLSRTAPRD